MDSAVGGVMQIVYLKFYLTEKQKHNGQLLYEWLLEQAQRIGIPGGSAFRSIAGFGRHGSLHAETFIELGGELPIQVEFILEEQQAEEFLATLRAYELNIRYVRYAVSAGVV
jgi:PII-like signaling protein